MTDERAGLPILSFPDRAACEAWLAAHPDAPGIWLRLAKKGSGLNLLAKPDAIDALLCHGWIDSNPGRYDDQSFLLRATPRRAQSPWSEINRTRALELIEAGEMCAPGHAEIEAARADGRWDRAYAPASRIEVPADLQAALDASPAAAAFFATLTGANRYAILYRIGAVKRPETRARKITQFVAMLERGETIHS